MKYLYQSFLIIFILFTNGIPKDNYLKTLILYQDPYENLTMLNIMIQQQFSADIYEINDSPIPDIKQYDFILIGSYAIDNHLTKEMIHFLNDFDFHNQKVSCYWMGAMDNTLYENELQSHMFDAQYYQGIGFNDDEISERVLIEYCLDEWIETLNESINQYKRL